MSNRFLFFGCWNSGGCNHDDPNPNALTQVMKHLNEFVENEKQNSSVKPEFLIVAGDNYYPPKEKKKDEKGETEKKEKKEKKEKRKNYIEEDIDSGFKCLNEIPIDKIILLGNHDVEQTIDNNKNTLGCNTINYQIEKYNNNLFNFNNFEDKLQTKMLGDHTIIIMFDSTIYDKKAGQFLECYKKINENFNDINDFIKRQSEQRDNTIEWIRKQPSIKNIIFTCHHPIIELKVKKNNLEENPFYNLGEFLLPFNELSDKKFIHLCADVHLYQSSEIIIKGEDKNKEMLLKQYVVGTGGAELDNDDNTIKPERFKDFIDINNENKYKYKLYDSNPINGFLDCKFENTEFKPTFIFTNKSIEIQPPAQQSISQAEKPPPAPQETKPPPAPPAPPAKIGGSNKKKRKSKKKGKPKRKTIKRSLKSIKSVI